MDPALRKLLDRTEVLDLTTRYARMVDQHDWVGLRACLADEIETDFSDNLGMAPQLMKADDIVAHISTTNAAVKTFHVNTNHHVEFADSDRAKVTAYVVAPNRKYRNGTPVNYDVLGWVEQKIQRQAASWIIYGLKFTTLWEDGDPTVLNIDRPRKD